MTLAKGQTAVTTAVACQFETTRVVSLFAIPTLTTVQGSCAEEERLLIRGLVTAKIIMSNDIILYFTPRLADVLDFSFLDLTIITAHVAFCYITLFQSITSTLHFVQSFSPGSVERKDLYPSFFTLQSLITNFS